MQHSSILNEKLAIISDLLCKKYKNMTHVGAIGGISGSALFQFYYAKYLNIDKYADIGTEIIFYCIEKINNGYSFPTFCDGIAGLGWTIQHLKTKDFIEIDCDSLLLPFDDYLFNQMIIDLKVGNYDFLHGALGYGFYFLSRYENTENFNLKTTYKSYILKLVTYLEELSVAEGSTLKWESVLDMDKGTKGFNLGLSHGIPSILNFLSRLYCFNEFKESTHRLILGSTDYILSLEDVNHKNLSLFPNSVEANVAPTYKSRIAWCYGDLGIGISLLRAGKVLNDNKLRQQALEILSHSANRKTDDETLVIDAGICHGSYGNALIYQKLAKNEKNRSFEQMFHYWIADGIKRATYSDGYAGYKQWSAFHKEWMPELNLLEGISGIGLVIIDALSKESNTWDECLLIS